MFVDQPYLFVSSWTICSPLGSSVHGIVMARKPVWVAIPSLRGSSQPRDQTQVSCTVGDSLPAEPPCNSKEYHSVQFSSFPQLCPTLCNHMDCSTPGLPVHHQLLEFIQTYVHRVGAAIQPSHPLSSPSPPHFSLSQHQGLFK